MSSHDMREQIMPRPGIEPGTFQIFGLTLSQLIYRGPDATPQLPTFPTSDLKGELDQIFSTKPQSSDHNTTPISNTSITKPHSPAQPPAINFTRNLLTNRFTIKPQTSNSQNPTGLNPNPFDTKNESIESYELEIPDKKHCNRSLKLNK